MHSAASAEALCLGIEPTGQSAAELCRLDRPVGWQFRT